MTAIITRADAAHLPLPDSSVDLIVTSPPYFGLRSYTDNVECVACIGMRRDGRDVRQAWPDYDAHVRDVHVQHYDGQIGSEATPQEFLNALWACTAEWMRVLKPSGSIFVNLGDKYSTSMHSYNYRDPGTYTRKTPQPDGEWSKSGCHGKPNVQPVPQESGLPPKCLMLLPQRYAIGCVDQLSLILRAEIIWNKPNGLPESVTDRVRRSHEQIFHFTRNPRYYAAVDEVREPHAPGDQGRSTIAALRRANPSGQSGAIMAHANGNPLGKLPGSVWEIPSAPLTVPKHLGVDHFAAYPPELCRRIILGWSPPGICTACGEGRRPVVDKRYTPQGDHNPAMGREKYGRAEQGHGDVLMGRFKPQEMPHGRANATATITGYACACPDTTAPTRPALVLDPFGGTGTSALVATMHGRLGITVDLSQDYSRLAAWRTRDPAERARALGVPKPPPVPDGQGDLFADFGEPSE